ncbi:hypothetical protein GCM10020331_084350 [Ectobacillus funiculus]
MITLAYLYEETEKSNLFTVFRNMGRLVISRYDENKKMVPFNMLSLVQKNYQQLWDDTLMMSVLPLAKIGLLLNKPEYVEEAKKSNS